MAIENKPTNKEVKEFNLNFLKEFLNLSDTGLAEILDSINIAGGKTRIIMHPDSISPNFDQTEQKNREINHKYETQFLPWFFDLLKKQIQSLEIGNEQVTPIVLFIEKEAYQHFVDSLEKVFGNHLTKFGVLIIPTENKVGRISIDLAEVVKKMAVKFGALDSIPAEKFSFLGVMYLFKLLGIKEVILAGGFIGEIHPEDSRIYGRCLGNLLTGFLHELGPDGKPFFKIDVDESNTFFKDGVDSEILKNSGVSII